MANNGLLSDADYDAMVQRHALAGVAATGDTSPDHAAQAIDAAPLSQIPPSVGMGAVDLSTRLAAQAARQAAITTSPAVAHFAATADPAHVAVAKDDFPALARIGAAVGDYAKWVLGGAPPAPTPLINADVFRQGSAALDATVAGAQAAVRDLFNPAPSAQLAQIKGLGQAIGGVVGLASAPIAAITGPVARALAPLLTTTTPVFPWESPRPLRTRQEQEVEANNLINLGLLGLGAKREPLPYPGTPASTLAPKLEGPNSPRPPSEADLHAQVVANIQAEVAASQTHTRSPSVMEGYLASQTGGHTVTVDPEVVDSLREQGHDPFPEVESGAIEPAEVPLSRYVAQTAGQPFADKLNSTTSFADGVPSVEEAKAGTFTSRPLAENYATHEFEYVSPSGERVSGVITPSENGRLEIDINGVGSELGGSTEGAGRLGVRGVRDLYRQLVAAYPDTQEIVGLRTTGARSEAKEAGIKVKRPTPAPKVEVPLDFSSEEAAHAKNLAAAYHDELNTLVKDLDLHNLFTEAKAVGATKTNFERYSTAIEQHIAEAAQRLTARAEAQVRRERTPEWKIRRAQHMDTVERELAQLPGIQARAAIAQGKGPLGEPLATSLRLDKADPLAKWAADNGLPDKYFKANGLSPDEAAPLFNFKSGADMLRELIALHKAQGDLTIPEHMKSLIVAHADERTRQELGFDLTPESIHQAASEALTGLPTISDFLLDDLKAFADEHGLPFDKAATKSFAQARFETRSVKQATNLKQIEGWLATDNKKLETALLKGDAANAFKWKQAQYLHQVELTSAHKFLKQFAKANRAFRQLAKKPVAKSMDQEARNYARAIVAQLGFRVSKGKSFEDPVSALKGKSLETYVRELTAQGTPVVHAVIPPVPIPQMTVDQFRGVWDMVNSITTLGREAKKVYNQGVAEDLDTIVAQIRANGEAVGRKLTAGQLKQARGKLLQGVPGHAARTLGSAVARPETYLFWLDREANGPLMQHIVNPLQDGKFYKADRMLVMNKEWNGFVKAQPKGWRDTLGQKVNVPELTFGKDADGLPVQWLSTKADVIMMATHFGTESNFQKLVDGFGWDADTVRAVADRELAEPDWKYVQFVLDQHEALLPEVQQLYRDTVGLGIDPVPATPIPTPFGQLRGGYRHVTYDWSAAGEFEDQNGQPVTVSDPNALGESDLFGHDYRVSTPPNKYTVRRSEFSAPINLDHNILHYELEAVVHDLAYRRALIQAAKIMRQPVVRQTIREVLGPEYLEQTNRWLQDIARQANYDQSQLKFFAGLVRGFRRRFTMYQIGYNMATLGKHAAIATAHIDGEVGIARFAQASAELLGRTPEGGQSLAAWVDEQSGEVRTALLNLDRDVRELIADELRKQGFVDSIRYNAFTSFGLVKQMEARATWLAKYRQLSEDGLTHEDAVALANKSVRDTQGAGGVVDLPALWRGGSDFWGEVGKLLNVFTNFENTGSNRMWTMIRSAPRMLGGFKDEGWAGGRRDFNKIITYSKSYIMLPAIFAAAFTSLTTDGGHRFLKHFYEAFLASSLGGSMPGGTIVAELPRMIANNGDMEQGALGSAIKDVVETGVDAWAAAHNFVDPHHAKKVENRWVQHAVATAGYMLDLPLKPVAKGGQYLWNITHHLEKTNPVDLVRGLLFGPKLKEPKK